MMIPGNQENAPGSEQKSGRTLPPGGAAAAGEREKPEINRLLGLMEENGVDGGIAVQKKGTYGFDNSYILDAAAEHGDKMLPVAVLDAEDVNTDDLVEYWASQKELAGVRFTGHVSEDGSMPWLNSRQALKAWAVADKYGLVVELMCGPPGGSPEFINVVNTLAETYKNARIVLDHIGFPNPEGGPDFGIDALYQSLAAHDNIYYKFTTINIHNLQAVDPSLSEAELLRRAVDVYGADHIMWGSDVGNSVGLYDELVGMMVEATSLLTDAEKQAVMHDTGKRVLIGGGAASQQKMDVAMSPPPAGPPAAEPPAVSPSLESALSLAHAAIAACEKKEAKIIVSVVDADGKPKVTLSADGSTGKATTAVRKAYTAVTFKASGSQMEKRAEFDQAFAELVASDPTQYNIHAGSLILEKDGEVVGGIGITGNHDHDLCEECGREAVAEVSVRLQ
jgi:uncharacterized protein GlcG (DUF336 family)/predicted TIM-barrel fold metal-dependent hydrolase